MHNGWWCFWGDRAGWVDCVDVARRWRWRRGGRCCGRRAGCSRGTTCSCRPRSSARRPPARSAAFAIVVRVWNYCVQALLVRSFRQCALLTLAAAAGYCWAGGSDAAPQAPAAMAGRNPFPNTPGTSGPPTSLAYRSDQMCVTLCRGWPARCLSGCSGSTVRPSARCSRCSTACMQTSCSGRQTSSMTAASRPTSQWRRTRSTP